MTDSRLGFGHTHYNVAPTIAHSTVAGPCGAGAANMRAVSGLNSSLAAGVLACSSLLCAAPLRASDGAPGPLTPVAHSAPVTLDAGPAPPGLVLRLRHTADDTPVSVTDLTVSIDGKSQLAMRRADGSWFVPLSNALLADDRLEVRSEERRVGKEWRSRGSPYH